VPGWLRTVTGVAAVLAVAGCGGSGTTALPPGPDTAGSTAPAGAASPSPTREADPVLAAYLRYWDAVVGANAKADPKDAALARVAAEPQLSRVRDTVSRNKTQQLSLRGVVRHAPKPAAVSGGTATLEDCYDISGWNPVNLKTGERVEVTEEGGTGRYRARYTLRRSGERWLVVDQRALGGC
jgi:hypothetical protein